MRRIIVKLLLFALPGLAIMASGCTSAQLYDAGQGWRQNQCGKILAADERSRCLDVARMPYDEYRKNQAGTGTSSR